ncbi:type II toxin-antitoxin system HicB family antitoxin [Brytella acorum]|uniref:Type II toxin-antitoxin system HicB family antitoxin n=1 Tax=Brytella acorum TaxID=2959299 RepID=A0AA35V2N1_9PROT|nr:type II toxin-antitoxin system HicB family antitoxin [Brytella acorum]CAI9121476.1 type II toxin-antitoxin system HicB family antitoxin [Brytella acorum]
MSVMIYKGYSARVEFEAEDGVFAGRIAGINDVVTFEGESVAELTAAFHSAVDDYIETCAGIGRSPDKPYSGRVMFRIAPEVHARAALAAELAGVSLNQWAERVLDKAAE